MLNFRSCQDNKADHPFPSLEPCGGDKFSVGIAQGRTGRRRRTDVFWSWKGRRRASVKQLISASFFCIRSGGGVKFANNRRWRRVRAPAVYDWTDVMAADF